MVPAYLARAAISRGYLPPSRASAIAIHLKSIPDRFLAISIGLQRSAFARPPAYAHRQAHVRFS